MGWKKKKKRKQHIFLWLYDLKVNNFFFISFFFVCLSLFCLFFGDIFKLKSSFWCYDLITSHCFVFNIKSYTFVKNKDIIVCMGYQLPLQKHPPCFLPSHPLNITTVQAPLFRQPPFYIGFSWTTTHHPPPPLHP